MNNLVQLENLQVASGMACADLRNEASKSFKNKRGLKKEEAEYYSQLGALGEVAFAVQYDLPYEMTVNRFYDPDFIVYNKNYNQRKIDVKAVQFKAGISERHLHSDWTYIFYRKGDFNLPKSASFKSLGWISGGEVLPQWSGNPGERYNDDGTPAILYTIPPEALHPMPKTILPYYEN